MGEVETRRLDESERKEHVETPGICCVFYEEDSVNEGKAGPFTKCQNDMTSTQCQAQYGTNNAPGCVCQDERHTLPEGQGKSYKCQGGQCKASR